MEKPIFTYFVQDEIGNIKVGTSFNPEMRLRRMQTGNASKLTILLFIFGDHEKQLHQKFDFYRIRNSEWFKPNKQLTRYINLRIDGFELIKEKRDFILSKIEEEEIWKNRMIIMRKEIESKKN